MPETGRRTGRGAFDWFHMNSATYVGPNHWYDEGDKRFAPDNVVISSRAASIVATWLAMADCVADRAGLQCNAGVARASPSDRTTSRSSNP